MEKEKKVLHCHLGIHGAPPTFYRIALHYFPVALLQWQSKKKNWHWPNLLTKAEISTFGTAHNQLSCNFRRSNISILMPNSHPVWQNATFSFFVDHGLQQEVNESYALKSSQKGKRLYQLQQHSFKLYAIMMMFVML